MVGCCPVCERVSGELSEVEITARAGSILSGKRVRFQMCGSCVDWFYHGLQECTGRIDVNISMTEKKDER